MPLTGDPVRAVAAFVATAFLASLSAAPVSAGSAQCNGLPATIVGTGKSEVIHGTPRPDVIVARGGNDTVYGRGGDDTICGGPGNDHLWGGEGSDTILGNAGSDTVFGGFDDDLLLGQTGRDRVFGGAGQDRLFGGLGLNRLNGGSGSDVCLQEPGTGRRVKCERLRVPRPARTLALAFSDLDGDHEYGPNDVMISKIVDRDGSGTVSVGDIIRLGHYPTTLKPKSRKDFHSWGRRQHEVSHVAQVNAYGVLLGTAFGRHVWNADGGGSDPQQIEGYSEYGSWPNRIESTIVDRTWDGGYESIELDPRAASQPAAIRRNRPGTGDAAFIDVRVYP